MAGPPFVVHLPAVAAAAMVSTPNPAQVSRDGLVLLKIRTVTDGIFMWEFLVTLGYEWDIIRGHRPYRPTIWIHSITRFAALIVVIMDLITTNVRLTDCQALMSFSWTSANIAIAFSSLLIFLRVPPIWEKNKVAVSLAAGVWVINAAILVSDAVRARSTWVPEEQSCSAPKGENSKPAVVSVFATDVILLLIMLVGLFRMRREVGDWFSLGWLLWRQGIIWILIAIVADLVPVVFIYLNLNAAFDLMFLMPAFVTMVIASTRMYRSLANYSSHSRIMSSDNAPRNGHMLPHANLALNTHNRMEATMHTTCEQYTTSLRNKNLSFSVEGEPRDKPRELSLPGDLEGNVLV